MTSIRTNPTALSAAQILNATMRDLNETQTRIATGLAVSGARDNAAVYQIAQTQRAELSGWKSVHDSLARGLSGLEVAATGSQQISDLLRDLREKVVAYSDRSTGGAARASLKSDIEATVRQIDSVAKNADFDGINLLTGRPIVSTRTSTSYTLQTTRPQPLGLSQPMHALPQAASAAGPTLRTEVTLPDSPLTPQSFHDAVATITGTNSQTVPVDAGPDPGRVSLLLDAYGVMDVAEIWQNGVRVAATGQPPATGGGAVPPGKPVAFENILTFDYDPANGQTLEFRFNENVSVTGTAWRVGGIILQDPSDPPPALSGVTRVSTQLTSSGEFTPVPDDPPSPEAAISANTLEPPNPAAAYAVDAGPDAGRIDVLFDAFETPDAFEVWQNGAKVLDSGPISGAQVLSFDYDPAAGRQLEFRFNADGGTPGSAWVVGGIVLNNSGDPTPDPQVGRGMITQPGFGPRNYDFVASPEGALMRATSRELTAAGLGLDKLPWEDDRALKSLVDAAFDAAIEAASYFGGLQESFSRSSSFNSRLSDALEEGIGNLVDADMAKESARLQALQVKQQLASQVLGIANASANWIPTLFKS